MPQAVAGASSPKDVAEPGWCWAEEAERIAWLDFFRCAPKHVSSPLALRACQTRHFGLLAARGLPSTVFNRTLAFAPLGRIETPDLATASRWLVRHADQCWRIQATLPGEMDEAPVVHDAGLTQTQEEWSKLLFSLAGATGHCKAGAAVYDATPRTARLFGQACQVGFDMPPICADWFQALVGRSGWTCKIAILNGQIAGAAAMRLVDRTAWLGMDSTLPTYRGRGIQFDLIASRLADAAGAGATYASAETVRTAEGSGPEDGSRRNYLRAGFWERKRVNLALAHRQVVAADGAGRSAALSHGPPALRPSKTEEHRSRG